MTDVCLIQQERLRTLTNLLMMIVYYHKLHVFYFENQPNFLLHSCG